MSHWLENEIKKLKEKELNLDQEKVKENVVQYGSLIEDFFALLTQSFDDLTQILPKDFKFHYRTLSISDISPCEFSEFSGINLTQKPAFLRRLQFIISDEPGKMRVLLFRGKHDHPDDPWKFHDKQEFMVDIARLDQQLVHELVDWFAWKSYSPRSLR